MRIDDIIDDLENPAQAHEAYLVELRTIAAQGNFMAGLTLRVAEWAQGELVHYENALVSFGRPKAFHLEWRPDAFVFVGEAGYRCFTRQIGGSTVIVIDFDLLCRLVLFVFFVGMDDDDDIVSQAVATFLLLSLVVPRKEPFPCMEQLVQHCSEINARVTNDIFTIVGRFILLHELGHSYYERFGSAFLRVLFDLPSNTPLSPDTIRDIRYHPDGPIYNQIDLEGSTNGLLVITPILQKWEPEFAADVFAAYGLLYNSTNSKPGPSQLDGLTESLNCWQLVLFAVGNRQDYLRAIADETWESSSHPPAATRVDVLIHHLNFFAEEYDPDWKSPTIPRLKKHYDGLWAKDLLALLNEAIEYVRYAFDDERAQLQDGRVVWTLGDEAASPLQPSVLTKLQRYFLEPFLHQASLIGWREAVQVDRKRYLNWLRTFRLNDKPIILALSERLHSLGIRLISEDRE